MARRNRSSVFEDITQLISYLPWWAGVLIAVISYFWLHSVASQPIPIPTPSSATNMGDVVVKQMWHTFAIYLQYIIPLCSLIGAGISAYSKFANTKESNTPKASNTYTQHKSIPPKSDQNQSVPACPQCGASMIKRTAKKGSNAGESFWGCSNYPNCKGTRAA